MTRLALTLPVTSVWRGERRDARKSNLKPPSGKAVSRQQSVILAINGRRGPAAGLPALAGVSLREQNTQSLFYYSIFFFFFNCVPVFLHLLMIILPCNYHLRHRSF